MEFVVLLVDSASAGMGAFLFSRFRPWRWAARGGWRGQTSVSPFDRLATRNRVSRRKVAHFEINDGRGCCDHHPRRAGRHLANGEHHCRGRRMRRPICSHGAITGFGDLK